MSAGSFAMVLEAEEVRRHIPDWPQDRLLVARRLNAGLVDAVAVDEGRLSDAVAGLAVVPARTGFRTAMPSLEAELEAFEAALARATAISADAPVADQFSDVENIGSGLPERACAVRRSGRYLEVKLTGRWDAGDPGAITIGSTFLTGIPARADATAVVFSVPRDLLGPSAHLFEFVPRCWTPADAGHGFDGPVVDLTSSAVAGIRKKFQLLWGVVIIASAGIVALAAATVLARG